MLSIFNAALVAQGLQEIVSENDGSAEFRVLVRNWPAIVEAELEDGAYNFARHEIRLHNREDGAFGYTDKFRVPAEAIHIRRVWDPADPCREFDWVQDGSHVHVSHPDPITIQYLTVAEPHLWSANFTRGVQMKLEAVILRALKEEPGEAQALENQAEVYFQRARTNSSKSRSAKRPIRTGRIAMARFGTGEHSDGRAQETASVDAFTSGGTPHNFISDYHRGKA